MRLKKNKSGNYQLINNSPEENKRRSKITLNGQEDLIEAYNLIQEELKELKILY